MGIVIVAAVALATAIPPVAGVGAIAQVNPVAPVNEEGAVQVNANVVLPAPTSTELGVMVAVGAGTPDTAKTSLTLGVFVPLAEVTRTSFDAAPASSAVVITAVRLVSLVTNTPVSALLFHDTPLVPVKPVPVTVI